MNKPIPISPQQHAGKFWKPAKNYLFAKKQAMIPLVSADLMRAVIDMPVVFTKKGELAALLGFKRDDNVFIDQEGKWLGKYIPTHLRTYPFTMARASENKMVLCVDETAIKDSGLPFFQENGEPTEQIQKIMKSLQQIEKYKAGTNKACKALSEHGVLKPWPIKIKSNAGDHEIGGLFKADEKALNELSAEAFMELRKLGALPIAYFQLLSMQHLSKMGKLAQEQIDQEAELVFGFDDRITF